MSLPINSLYSLTWGDYGTSLVSAVQLLRCHGDLVDVTLAAGGRSFPAHKIVLCAASPFLLDLLKNTPCKHPVVMLAGVNANDLEALLEFVYRGEVSVDHSQLPSLLQAAHCLNIQGLAPQTVSHKDDNTTYTTSIQLHPTLVPQHQQVKAVIDVGNNVCFSPEQTEDLITTLTPTQTVQAQVIETITPEQMSDEVTKDVISQFLPTRKRKSRPKKPSQSQGTNAPGIQQQQQPQQQQQVATATVSAGGTQAAKVLKTDEEGTIQTIIVNSAEEAVNVVKDIKKEAQVVDGTATTAAVMDTKDGIIKIKNKSQSEQPATCPICQAVIRQSRNLRRHLELRHFKKPGMKKERVKKTKQGTVPGQANTSGTAGNGTVTTVEQQQQAQAQQAQQTAIETAGTISVTVSQAQAQQLEQAAANGQQHVVTQHENADGTTSLSIAQVQTLDGHQLAIGNLNQATLIRTSESIEAGIIATHEPTLRPHTELFRVGNTVYTIEERRPDQPNRLT